jgi:hypothetical protein
MTTQQRHIDKAREIERSLSFLTHAEWDAGRSVDIIAAALAEAEGEWTRVEDGLPESYEDCEIVWAEHGHRHIQTAYFEPGQCGQPHRWGICGYCQCVTDDKGFMPNDLVTHWRELPPMPEGW